MIPRYAKAEIEKIFSDREKLLGWDTVELAVIEARVNLNLISREKFERIRAALVANPPNVKWWIRRDQKIGHDLNAYVEERRRHLEPEDQDEFHKDTTSYDTEESTSATHLIEASTLIAHDCEKLLGVMEQRSNELRYVIMLERTHGQGAKLRSFGGRILTWLAPLRLDYDEFKKAVELCRLSRLSGAIGNFGGGLSPEIEKEALRILSLTPFAGATQILPREVTVHLAQRMRIICETLNKMSVDIRLGARSGLPINHEPFARIQKGSSAMPHKKNPIRTEQMTGMKRLAKANSEALVEGIETWEGRTIEQSCVERVSWPDLFQITMHMLQTVTKVLAGLVVYPDNMLREIVEAKGTYASDEAKGFLAEEFALRGIGSEDAYRVIQLASFCLFKPQDFWAKARLARPANLTDADAILGQALSADLPKTQTLRTFVRDALLFAVPELQWKDARVRKWNRLLKDIFSDPQKVEKWNDLFKPSYLLKSEAHLFAELLGS